MNYSLMKGFKHNLYLGSRPDDEAEMRGLLARKGIGTVVVLLEENYLSDNVIHYPIADYSVPPGHASFDEVLQKIHKALKNHSVFIHCSAGIGRTGLVTAGFLMKYRGYDPDRAIEETRRVRKGAVETYQQMDFLHGYEGFLRQLHKIDELDHIFSESTAAVEEKTWSREDLHER